MIRLKFVVDTLNNVPKRTEEDLLNLQLEGGACSLKQFSPILQQQEPPHPRVQDFLHWIFTEQVNIPHSFHFLLSALFYQLFLQYGKH